MKKGLLFSIVALAAIVIVAVFNMQLKTPMELDIPESMVGNILYVCPVADPSWDSAASGLYQFMRYIIGGFFFGAILLMFGWGWNLYQNMLGDKFKRDSFKTIWLLTKLWFWGLVIVSLLVYTPNHFRRVDVAGSDEAWVLCNASDLCDVNSPDCRVRAVRADAVHAH